MQLERQRIQKIPYKCSHMFLALVWWLYVVGQNGKMNFREYDLRMYILCVTLKYDRLNNRSRCGSLRRMFAKSFEF